MKVLGSELYDNGYNSLLTELISGLKGNKESKLISPSDANVLVHAFENKSFLKVLQSYEYNLPDGMPSVWIGRLKGAKEMSRCSGPDLFPDILRKTKDMGINHYFIGSTPEIVLPMIDNIKSEIGNFNICGYYCPPFKEFTEEEIKEMAEMANNKNADFVWVGLGGPKQIVFSKTLSKYTDTYFIAAVGAAFGFMASHEKKAPKWIQKYGLEWAYRILSDPKRLGKRYLKVIPKFIFYNIIEATGISRH